MVDKIPCKTCGFDLASLPMTLPQSHPAKNSGTRDVEVFCPVCGEQHVNLMKNKYFFLRETRDAEGKVTASEWRYWVDRPRSTQISGQRPGTVPIGSLNILFGEEAKPIRTSDVHYQQVPRFMHQEGGETKAVMPTLPVRPEFLDCLDPEGLRRIRSGDAALQPRVVEKGGKRLYQCILPRRGEAAEEWTKNPLEIPLGPDVEGVFLRHWPNIDDIRWRTHLVSLGFDEVRGASESARGWEAQAVIPQVRTNSDQKLEEDEVVLYRERLPTPSPKESGRRVFSAGIEGRDGLHQGRPAWIALYAGGLGGVFSLPPGDELPLTPMEFGLDFGTSNTVIATQPMGKSAPETVAPNLETTRWLIGRIDPRVDPDDLWPGAPWTGGERDLLPSELLLRDRSWPEFNQDCDKLSLLKLGVGIGVPLMMAQPQRDPQRSAIRPMSLLSDFKWQRALRAQSLEGLAQEAWRVQAKFLEAAMLMTLASRIRNERVYPSSVNLWYSYPPAFGEKDKQQLDWAGGGGATPKPESMAARLQKHLSLRATVGFVPGPDEASAAVFNHDPNREFAVFVDIGGGSMEVVVRDEYVENGKGGHAGLEQVVTSKSLYFGGGVYLRSLVGDKSKGCLLPGMDYPQLASRIRRYGSGTEFIEAPSVFGPQRLQTARLRAQVFGEAVADYVARTLAGMSLEHGFQRGTEQRPEAERRLNLTRNRLFYWNGKAWQIGGGAAEQRRVKFTLFLLGNGWNTVEIAVPDGSKQDVETFFAARVRSRLRALIKKEEATARRISDGEKCLLDVEFVIECPRVLDLVKHRKAVVATEVLKQKTGAGVGGREMRRGVMGLALTLGSRHIEWYRPFGPPQLGDANLDKARKSKISLQTTRPPEVLRPEVRGEGSMPPPLPFPEPQVPPLVEIRDWHLASSSRASKGQWDFNGLIAELQKQPDAGEWLVWKKGALSTWTRVCDVPELWERLRPKVLWAVALGKQALGSGLDLEAARRTMLSTGAPADCKVWCKDFKQIWKPVTDVPEFAEVLPPPLSADGPPSLDPDGPPPLDSN